MRKIENPSKDNPSKKGGADWRESFREAGPYVGLGMQMAMVMAFFTGAGYLVDHQAETTPWFTIAGGLLGMVAVFVQLVRIANRLGKPRSRPPGRDRRSE